MLVVRRVLLSVLVVVLGLAGLGVRPASANIVAVITLTGLRTQPSYTVTASCNALPGLVAATSAPSRDVAVTGQNYRRQRDILSVAFA